jgi:ubiquinol-cytochrome c reductase cytochrome b subunit
MAARSEPGWLEKRLGAGSALRRVLDEDIPGGAKFTYVLGSTTLLTFLTLAVTGIWQLVYYVPSTGHAYDSVNFLRFEVPLGWLIHGIHYWAATAMVVLVLLHLSQVFIWGAFKKPRELTWILGVLLLLFTLGSVFTGGPLAWDEKGYWAARVGSNLAGSVPLVGGFLKNVVFGGPTLGQLGLSRLFGLHVAVLPILIALVLLTHLVAFRKGGAAGTWKPSGRVGAFWPDQLLKDLGAFAFVLTAIVGLSAFLLTPVSGPADPIDATYVGRPDWPFLWLFQLLKYLPGRLEALGIVVVPLIGLAVLLLVPWLGRNIERSPARRPAAMASYAVVVLILAGLTWLAVVQKPAPLSAPSGPPSATPAAAIESTPAIPGPSAASHTIGGAAHGESIFVSYCEECHGPQGTGGVANPNSADGTVPELNPIDPEIKSNDPQTFVDNLDVYLQNGSVPEAQPEGADPMLKMPSFGNTYALTQQQIADAEAYVMSLNGVKRAVITNAGIAPAAYAYGTFAGFAVTVVLLGMALSRARSRQV